jgi:hypothetical protein
MSTKNHKICIECASTLNIDIFGRCNLHRCYGYVYTGSGGDQYIKLCSRTSKDGIQCHKCYLESKSHNPSNPRGLTYSCETSNNSNIFG